MSADAHPHHRAADDGDGARRCMLNALRNARSMPTKFDYLNAHGTSTPLGDINETQRDQARVRRRTRTSSSSTRPSR